MSTAVEDARAQLQNEITQPPILRFPSDWQLSGSWQRAQEADSVLGSDGPLRFSVMIRRDSGEWGTRHHVLFCIHDGELRSECDCKGWKHRQWCSHVALLWWRWVRQDLGVT